jgi:2-polyprenyl-3-methyl-5-hydroxy-6-metoxy-1,4-benzoquinol methylase
MTEFVKDCPLCGFDHHSLFEITDFCEFKVENQICKRCGFVFQSPRMSEKELDEFYKSSYRQIYQGEEGPTRKDLANQKERAMALVEFAGSFVPQVESLLDIGCSAGLLLDEFQRLFCGKVTGVEPGDAYRSFAHEKGLRVYANLEQLQHEDSGPFDLISMVHVLEHISQPVAYLLKLRQDFLNPQGWLLIEVPNLLIHDSFELAHMSSFSRHSLKEALKHSGFSIRALKAHGAPRSKILPLYLTVLAQSSAKEINHKVKPERWVRQKRSLGMVYRRIVQRFFPRLAWVVQNFPTVDGI